MKKDIWNKDENKVVYIYIKFIINAGWVKGNPRQQLIIFDSVKWWDVMKFTTSPVVVMKHIRKPYIDFKLQRKEISCYSKLIRHKWYATEI